MAKGDPMSFSHSFTSCNVLVLTYQRGQARAGELMSTSNLWTCSDGINPIRCSGSDHTVDKSKALRSFGSFKVILPTATSE